MVQVKGDNIELRIFRFNQFHINLVPTAQIFVI